MKAVIFGTGDYYRRYKNAFLNMEIVCFIDNDSRKWGTFLDGHPIISPKEITNWQFDYIFLVSVHYQSMRKQALDLGIPECKIIDEKHLLFLEDLVATENYIFAENAQTKTEGKNILLISHALDLTGAPVVLCRLAHVLKRNGYNVTVYAQKNSKVKHGDLLFQLLQDRISVSLFTDLKSLSVEDIKCKFDLFWVNTILLYYVVGKLLPLGKKVYWWLHEADDFYELTGLVKYPQGDNLYVFSGGWMAGEAYEKYSGQKVTGNLMYGMPDCKIGEYKALGNNHKIYFGLIGVYSERKGQDILYSAILEYCQEWENDAEFLFVGVMPEEIKEKYEKVSNIRCIGEVSPEKLSELYESLDVLICASKFDPMPVVVSEAMQHKKTCLVTNKVGQSRYITEGRNGLVCEAGNKNELASKIKWALEHKDDLENIGINGYEIYKKYFSMDAFEKNILGILSEN